MNQVNDRSFPSTKMLLLFCFAFVLSCCSDNRRIDSARSELNLTRWVDPFIGTGFHGHVFLGANVPFGAVQLGPVNLSEGWDWCSGYHYSDSTIIGFSHTHLSGTGVGDLGDVCLMPAQGDVVIAKGTEGKPETGYYSLFSHDQEKAVPGYYSVYLRRYAIKAELTATQRTGFHQYTFPASEDSKIIIDLETGIGWDSPVSTFINMVNDTTVTGFRFSTGWANDQRIFFTAIFSKPIKKFLVYDSVSLKRQDSLTGKKVKGVALFSTSRDEKIKVKVGLSPVSMENAMKNIQGEIPRWDFDEIVKEADAAWNTELNKIKFQINDTSRLRTFYTAMYHTMIAPSIFNDQNGDYRGTDKIVHQHASFTNLTTFSLWDTYRGAHPLYTIFQPGRVNDMVNSMLAIYQQQGKLPVWHLMGNETNTMPGYSAVQVIADAYLKGFRGFNTILAWDAVKTTAIQEERGLHYVKKYGFIPADSVQESVAIGLEYAIADWGIAQMAKEMGKTGDYDYFSRRAKNYRYYFDTTTKFMRGRVTEKEWRTPFNPYSAGEAKHDYSEGNAWQYTWLVPQDVEGLISLFGNEKSFTGKLDSFFIATGNLGSEAPPDISGLIGQYAHGNEPSHHIAYLYAYVDQPWKTADKVRYILDSLYTDKPDGLCGNEDVGQMSAWYVLSSLGFYQVNPSNGVYVFGSPAMNDATLTLPNGKIFDIHVKNNNKQDKYIQRITLNGKEYSKSYILYKDIMSGGELNMEMGDRPSATWGIGPGNRPFSGISK